MRQQPIIPADKARRGQWLVSRAAGGPAGWATFSTASGWTLAAADAGEVQRLADAKGRAIGFVIGQPIDLDTRRFVNGGVTLGWAGDPAGLDAAIEKDLYRLSGAWACLIDTGKAVRLYHDAAGLESLVFDPVSESAASTAGLLLADQAYAERFESELYERLDIEGEGWIPGSLTAHRGIVRLTANHYLDLATLAPMRHWPRQPFEHDGSVEDAAADVAAIVRATVEAALAQGKVAVALTGGLDTRVLLAALKPLAKDVTFITLAGPGTERDVAIASHLSERFGLRHRLLPVQQATQAEQDRWVYAAGHCVTGQNRLIYPSIRPLQDEFAWFAGGVTGEVGRAFFWRPSDKAETALTGEALAPRLGMPTHPAVVDDATHWLEEVAGLDAFNQLDLAYMEMRLCSWSGSQTYAQAFVNHLYPFSCREVFARLLNVSPEAKRSGQLFRSLVSQSWPELAQVPINRYGDIRDTLYLLHKATNSKLVAKKLRKLFG